MWYSRSLAVSLRCDSDKARKIKLLFWQSSFRIGILAIRPVALRRPLIFAYIKDFGASDEGSGSFDRLHPLGEGLGLLWSSGSSSLPLLMAWWISFDSNASTCIPGLEGISGTGGRNLTLMG